MPQSRQHESSMTTDPGDWGVRALAIAAALDTAADELRQLIEGIRAGEDPESGDTEKGHKPNA
jgi:hypothetical protein